MEYDAVIRISCFLVLLMLFLFLEAVCPHRVQNKPSNNRRFNNLALLGIDSLVVRLLVPLTSYEVALMSLRHELGLFNIITLPFLVNIVLTIIIFDFLIYIQHLLFHKFRVLWCIHRVHHTDINFDVTTSIRFHPFEIVISSIYKLLAVYLFGPAAFSIVLYEVLLNSAALFTHSNIIINNKFDRAIRILFVTPDMHRLHHSSIQYETDSNYGNLFSFWDRLFKTYRQQPETGHEHIRIGLDDFRDEASNHLLQLLKNPFLISK